ncbi:MAG TPA: response regulator FixJ [Acetobacteraceae bacterium]|jgi:two-component system response regulator FixJ|nr:response regulator FixJ [Acetobacteraceae bacterium]
MTFDAPTGTYAPSSPKTTGPVVHVVDDDEAVRRSLALLLVSFGYATATYESAEAFLGAIGRAKPGCLIVDIRMSGMDGLELQEDLQRRRFPMPVIVVTGHGDVGLAVRAMKAGAVDFVEKPYSDDDLLRAVTTALARFEDGRQQKLQVDAALARIAVLTPRERDVLKLLIDGRPNKVIAHELGISPRTVEIHRANVMEKLACRSLADAVRLALAAGFVGA